MRVHYLLLVSIFLGACPFVCCKETVPKPKPVVRSANESSKKDTLLKDLAYQTVLWQIQTNLVVSMAFWCHIWYFRERFLMEKARAANFRYTRVAT